jgi:hypothetical protein
MHVAVTPPSLHVNLHASQIKQHYIANRPALHLNTSCALTTGLERISRSHTRSVRALARVSAGDEESEEDLADWEEDDDGLDVEEFENVTITTDLEDNG